jgi:hypothetical protein
VVHVKNKKVRENETGHAGQSKQPRPVQILNKGLLNVSRFKVWDSFVVFFAVTRSSEARMNETDQKILKKPELHPWDRSGRRHASDLKDDLVACAGNIDQCDGGNDD